MKKKIINIEVIYLVLYRLTLDLIYHFFITDNWSYAGFTSTIKLSNIIVSWSLFIFFIPFILKLRHSNKPSNIVLILLFLLAFVPSTSTLLFKGNQDNLVLFTLMYWLFISLLQFNIKNINIRRFTKKEALVLYKIILFTMILTVIFVSYKFTGFRINLNIFNVYELRSEASLFKVPTPILYLFTMSRSILPIFIIYNLKNKNKILSIILGFIQLLLFSVDGSKVVLFSLLLTFAIYYFIEDDRFIMKRIFKLFFIFNSLAILEPLIFKTRYMINIIIRRVMFLPQILNYYYFDYFSSNPFDYFRQSFLGKIGIKSPYSIKIANLIGEQYYGSAANNGLISDAYYNLGFLGIIIMPFIIILMLRLFDMTTERIDFKLYLPSTLIISMNLISSSIFTILISHGFLFVMLVFYMIYSLDY